MHKNESMLTAKQRTLPDAIKKKIIASMMKKKKKKEIMTKKKGLLDAFPYFADAGRLTNFRTTPVVRKAIRDYDRKKNQEVRRQLGRDFLIGTGTVMAGALSINPIARGVITAGKGIRKAYKMAGSIGNTKKPDTVGNRIRQAQAIMGKSPKDKPFGNRASMLTQDRKPASTKNPMLGTVVGTSASTKYYRTLTKAIEQGPSKFFSKGRHSKTGITPNKRKMNPPEYAPEENVTFPPFRIGAKGGTSRGSLLRHLKK